MYDKIFQYVEEYLEKSGKNRLKERPFRKRSEHIKRVYMWAKRILDKTDDFNEEALLVAALFHDIGYADCTERNDHAEFGAKICEEYLRKNDYEFDFIKFVVYLVRNHSNKTLMKQKDTPLELILLMEADLLDETGALSIVWDSMTEGNAVNQAFHKTYEHIVNYSGKLLNQNPMVTDKAKAYWVKKQELTKTFIEQLAFDLGI